MHLEIGNSISRLSELTSAEFEDIRKILSYESDAKSAYFSGYYGSARRYLIDKQGCFPTGLLPHVEEYCKLTKRLVRVDKRGTPPVPSYAFAPILSHTPYKEQMDAAMACVAANRGIVSACTGFGKSLVIALVLIKLQVRTLIIVPNLELKRQLTESLTKIFGCVVGEHGFPIAVENVDSSSLNTTEGKYQCLIIDEAHHVAAKTYRTLNKKYWNDIFYRFFFTATPYRTQTEEQLLFESIAGQVIYTVSYKDAVAKGYVTPVEAYYVEVPVTREVKGYTYAQVYNELVTNNAPRNKLIANLLINLRQSGIPTLCLVKEIANGNHIFEYITSLTNGYDSAPFAHGENEYTGVMIQGFNMGKFKTLIGTVGVLGEGVDTKPAEFVVIAGLGKAKGQFMQQVGRGLRVCKGKESTKVIIFKDKSHKYTLRHFSAQVKILAEEYGVKPVKLEV